MDAELVKFFESTVGGGVVLGVYALLKLIFSFVKNVKKSGDAQSTHLKEQLDMSLTFNSLSNEITRLNNENEQTQRKLELALSALERLSVNFLVVSKMLASQSKLKRQKR